MGQHKAILPKKDQVSDIVTPDMKVEYWQDYRIRFVEIDGEWWAILKDICDALRLKTFDVSQRLESSMIDRVAIQGNRIRPERYKTSQQENYDMGSTGVVNSETTLWMLAVNELGIYEALFASKRIEARKFRIWSLNVMKKLRRDVGLEGFEVMRMTEPEIQEEIDYLLDTLYWDEETGKIMQSVTVQGGDVEQVPYEE